MIRKITFALLLLAAPIGAAKPEARATFRVQVVNGQTVLMPVLPVGLVVQHAGGPAVAPGEIVACKLVSVEEGISLRCGPTDFRLAGIAISE